MGRMAQYLTVPEPYEIESAPAAPVLPGSVQVRPSEDDAIAAAAADLMMQALACARSFGEFHLALTPSPRTDALVVRLMTDPNYREFPWDRTHVWSAAEHRVSPEDDRHSMRHLGEMLLHGSDLPRDQAHAMPAHLPDADARYHDELCEHLARRTPGHDRLDCVVLPADAGMLAGVDDPLDRLFASGEQADDAHPENTRITLSARAIRGSRLVVVLATGDTAQPVLDNIAEDHARLGIVPVGGQLRWYLDRRACGFDNLE